MYSMEELGPNLMLAPASGNISYHNAYEGGYIDHIMNVARNSLRMMKLYQEAGGVIKDLDLDKLNNLKVIASNSNISIKFQEKFRILSFLLGREKF